MDFAVASKQGAPLAGLLKNLLLAAPSSSALRPVSSVAAARRLLSTQKGDPSSRDDDYYVHVECIDGELVFYQQLHARVLAHPLFCRAGGTTCGWWVSKEDDDTMGVKVQMPGLAAEHVKVRADHKGLFIKGEGVKDPDDLQTPERFSCRIDFSAKSFMVNQALAEMKDGVLKVTVPRVKKDLGDNTEIKVHKS